MRHRNCLPRGHNVSRWEVSDPTSIWVDNSNADIAELSPEVWKERVTFRGRKYAVCNCKHNYSNTQGPPFLQRTRARLLRNNGVYCHGLCGRHLSCKLLGRS